MLTVEAGDLVRFLLARLDDDRATLKRLRRHENGADGTDIRSVDRLHAETVSKRHMIGSLQSLLSFRDLPSEKAVRDEAVLALRALALPYSEHRSYRAEWRISKR